MDWASIGSGGAAGALITQAANWMFARRAGRREARIGSLERRLRRYVERLWSAPGGASSVRTEDLIEWGLVEPDERDDAREAMDRLHNKGVVVRHGPNYFPVQK